MATEETRPIVIPVEIVGEEDATKDLKKLTDQQNKQTEATEDGTESQEEYSKSLTDSAKDVKIFGISLNSVTKGFKASLGAIKGAVLGLKSFKVALIATGIGAIVVALGSLVVLLTQTQGGLDLVTKVTNAVGVAFSVLIDRAITFGRGIVKLFTGDFKGAVDSFRESFQGIGAEIATEVRAINDLSDATAGLEKRQIAFIVTNARLRAELKEQNLLVEDTTKSFEERLVAGQAALDIETERLNQALSLAAEELRILRERNALGTSTNEDIRKEAELEAELFRLREESAERFTTAQNKVNILLTQADKATQDQLKAANELIKVQNQGLDLQIEKQGIVIDTKKKEVVATDDQIQGEKDLGNTIGSIGAELGKFGKSGAIAAALGQLGVAIARVFGQTGVFGFAAIGPVIGAVTAAISSIRSAAVPAAPKFGTGGWIGGNLHSGGGTLIEAERGEYMISRDQMAIPAIARAAEALNASKQSSGFRFQEGGFIGTNNTLANQLFNIQQAIAQQQTVLVTEDFNRVQNRVTVTEERATL